MTVPRVARHVEMTHERSTKSSMGLCAAHVQHPKSLLPPAKRRALDSSWDFRRRRNAPDSSWIMWRT